LIFYARSVAALTILLASPLYSQETEETLDDARDFDLPASEISDLVGDGGFDLTDTGFEGNPLKRFAEKWPKDLVIAPIPGYSPWLLPTARLESDARRRLFSEFQERGFRIATLNTRRVRHGLRKWQLCLWRWSLSASS
jgi:hypothetical protein